MTSPQLNHWGRSGTHDDLGGSNETKQLVIAVLTVAFVVMGLHSSPAGADGDQHPRLVGDERTRGVPELVDSSGNGLNGKHRHRGHRGCLVRGATGHRFAYLTPNTPPAHPQHIWIPSRTMPSSTPGAADYTVTVRMRTTQTFGNIVQKGQSGHAGGYFKFENPNGIVTCLYRGSAGSNLVSSLRPSNDGKWHTIRCERTQYCVTMTVDGVVTQRLKGVTGTISNTWPLSIAGKVSCDQITVTCDYFVGDIDYVRIEGPASPNPDVTPPSAPGTPTATSTASGRATMSWAAATDDRATSLTYSVFRDGGTTPIGNGHRGHHRNRVLQRLGTDPRDRYTPGRCARLRRPQHRALQPSLGSRDDRRWYRAHGAGPDRLHQRAHRMDRRQQPDGGYGGRLADGRGAEPPGPAGRTRSRPAAWPSPPRLPPCAPTWTSGQPAWPRAPTTH